MDSDRVFDRRTSPTQCSKMNTGIQLGFLFKINTNFCTYQEKISLFLNISVKVYI